MLAHFHASGLPPFGDLEDAGRRRIIANRLSDGCTVADLKAAIDGAKRSKLAKRDLPVIFRNRESVERLRDQPPDREELEAQEAERRVQAEYVHTQRELAKCEDARRNKYVPTPEEMAALTARRDRKAAEQRDKQGGQNPIGNLIDLSSFSGRGR